MRLGHLVVALASGIPTAGLAQATTAQPVTAADISALADRTFSRIDSSMPGCVVGVAREGSVLLQRAYGLADLERATPLDTLSILEAGSVAKQFTAAAVTLLALDGKLRFDDEIQRFFPEIPRYERPITVRHLLDHTSGLRDWGDIASLAGWPRGSRAYTHAHVLEIIARQRSTNYAPGARYSYTNSGYNLLAMLVERVSGQSLNTFSRERIFGPLGMTRTSWRDDFRRIVPGRALAYEPVPGMMGLMRLDMPNEDVHGNGGLLSTVGDLLIWNEALTKRTLGSALVDSLTRRGVLTDGTVIPYAAGLVVDSHRGTSRIAHSGSTAGYRAYLARFPMQGDLSVAVMCNDSGNPTVLALAMVDGLADDLEPANPPARPVAAPPVDQPAAEALQRHVGEYTSDEVGASLHVALTNGRLTVQRRPEQPTQLTATTGGRFTAGAVRFWFTRDASGRDLLHVATGRAHDVEFRRVP